MENGPAVDDAERPVHAQPQALEQRGEVPGVDCLAVDRSLAADCLEARPMQEGCASGWLLTAWSRRAEGGAGRGGGGGGGGRRAGGGGGGGERRPARRG